MGVVLGLLAAEVGVEIGAVVGVTALEAEAAGTAIALESMALLEGYTAAEAAVILGVEGAETSALLGAEVAVSSSISGGLVVGGVGAGLTTAGVLLASLGTAAGDDTGGEIAKMEGSTLTGGDPVGNAFGFMTIPEYVSQVIDVDNLAIIYEGGLDIGGVMSAVGGNAVKALGKAAEKAILGGVGVPEVIEALQGQAQAIFGSRKEAIEERKKDDQEDLPFVVAVKDAPDVVYVPVGNTYSRRVRDVLQWFKRERPDTFEEDLKTNEAAGFDNALGNLVSPELLETASKPRKTTVTAPFQFNRRAYAALLGEYGSPLPLLTTAQSVTLAVLSAASQRRRNRKRKRPQN